MCQIALYQNIHCKCRWGEIALPCAPGMGFSTCGQIGNGIATPEPEVQKCEFRLCPKHGLQGVYDENQVRMVARIRSGVKWGTGPSRQDAGVELPCVIL